MQQLTHTASSQTPIARPRYDFLKNEIARWQEESILNRAQGDEILARYSTEGGKQHGLLVLLVAGSCIVGLSAMLFISTNWQGASIQIKGLTAVCLMLACYIAGWTLKGKSPLKSILAESLVFLGCVFFGAITILISQHFQITGDHPELLLWAMGIAPIVVLFRSHPSAILCAGIMAYRSVQPSADHFSVDWLLLLSTMSAVYCAYYTKSQVALVISVGACAAALSGSRHNVDEFVALFFGIGCFIAHLWHEHSKRWQVMSMPYLLLSYVLVMTSIFILVNEYSSQSLMEKFSTQRIQISAILTLASLCFLVKSPVGLTRWPIATGFAIIAAVLLSCYGTGCDNKTLTLGSFFAANLFYLFYITSSIENRLIQFLPVATLTIFAIIFAAAAPGGAMLGSGIAFGVGLVLMICSFAALGRSMRTVSERSLK